MTENLKSEELNDISSHNFNLKNLKYVHMYRLWNIETYMYITSDTECKAGHGTRTETDIKKDI